MQSAQRLLIFRYLNIDASEAGNTPPQLSKLSIVSLGHCFISTSTFPLILSVRTLTQVASSKNNLQSAFPMNWKSIVLHSGASKVYFSTHSSKEIIPDVFLTTISCSFSKH